MDVRKLRLLAGISLVAVCQPAWAQDVVQDPVPASEAQLAVDSDNDVVVTGSRIPANGDSQPTPVTVASTESLLKTSPSNIPDGLNKLPIFALSRGTSNLNNSTDNFTGNYLNLRGFGIQRNLVLLDGHRVAPTSYTGAVDTNVLPQLLVQRVEVVTGGASAVYGSDAVSGVINFILDKKFEGIKAEGHAGVSSRGDAFSWRVGAAGGMNFGGDRGHVMASFEHFEQNGLLKEDRRNGRRVYAVAGSGSDADPFRLITNARSALISFQGTAYTGPPFWPVFTSPGVLGPTTLGEPQGGFLFSGGDGFYGKDSSATADLKTSQAFARLDYDVTDDVTFYLQGNYARAKTFNVFYPQLLFPTLIGADNAFLSPATQTALGAGSPNPFFAFARVFDSPDHALAVASKSTNWSGAGGLTGKTAGLDWNIHYQHGVSTTFNTQVNQVLLGNAAAALDAVDQGLFQTGTANGNIVCRVTLTNPSAYPGCIPLNAFGASPESQREALDYILDDYYNRPRFTMDNFEASVSGTAFENWAGPVRFAISGEYRKLKLDVTTNAPSGVFADCTGLSPFMCTPGATPVYRDAQITPSSDKENVKEIAGEVDFPLFKDSAVGSANLNAAVRYTDYSTSGGVVTWKLGGDWQIIDGLRFRATRSRDIRAPSLYELYQPASVAQSGYQDLHTGGAGFVATETTGNSNLVPEEADTLTFGAVFKPRSIPGLSFAIDYYKIKIGNALSLIDGRLQNIQKSCEDSGGTGPTCALYDRPNPFSDTTGANYPTLVRLTTLNASSVKTWGIDGEVNYSFPVGSGRLSLRGLVGYQPVLTTVLVPGATPLKGAGTAATQSTGGVPKLRLTGFVSYNAPRWSVDLQQRWRSSLKWDADRSIVYDIPDVPSVAYTDVTFTAYLDEQKRRQLFVSVQNLFDKNPPVYLTAGTSGTPAFSFPATSGDDILGRYFTAGAKFRF